MKKILLALIASGIIIFGLVSLASAQITVPAGGTGSSTIPAGRVLFGDTTLRLGSSVNLLWDKVWNKLIVANLAATNATSTNATSTTLAATFASTTDLNVSKSLTVQALSGILKATAGLVSTAASGVDYEVPLTFGDGLTRTSNDVDCDTADGSTFGCLLAASFTEFRNKVSSSSLSVTDNQIAFGNGTKLTSDADLIFDDTNNILGVATTSNSGSIFAKFINSTFSTSGNPAATTTVISSGEGTNSLGLGSGGNGASVYLGVGGTAGTIGVNAGGNGANVYISNGGDSDGGGQDGFGGQVRLVQGGTAEANGRDGAVYIGTATNNSAYLQVNGSTTISSRLGIGTSSPSVNYKLSIGGGGIHVGGNIISTSTTATSTFAAPISLTKIVTSATSTGSNGFDITAGCYAVAGTCISGSGSSASSTLLVDTNTWSGLNAFGNLTATNATTTSLAVLNLATPAGTYLAVNPDGSVIATTTPVGGSASSTLLADTNTWSGLNVFNQATTTNLHITSTTTGANGFDITAGCYAVNGTCISGGGGSGTVNSGLVGQLAYYASDGTAVSGTTTNPLTVGYLVATSSVASIIPYASTTALTISGPDGALRVTNSATFDDGLVANNPVYINDPLTVSSYNGQIQINREAEAGYSQVKIGGTSGVDWGFGVAASSYDFVIFDGYPGANIITLRDHGYQDYYGHDQLVLGGTERSGFGTSTPSAGLSASTTINIGLMIDQRGTEDIAKFLDAGVEVLNLKDGGSLGVGTTTPAVKLDVNGYLKVLQTSTTTACSAAIAGSIFFNQANTHFWGCDGTNWLRLD